MKTLQDLTTPAEIQPKPLLERDVQNQCVDWARKRGYLVRKFSSIARRSVPDYLMFRVGCHFWVEFKAPGKRSTEAQAEEQALLLSAGLRGFECDNFEGFKETVVNLENA